METDVKTGEAAPANRGASPEFKAKTFKPGQSGNPNGRPKKVLELEQVAREASIDAFKRIIKLSKSSDERIALAASIALVERAAGKPKQSVAVDTKSKGLNEMSTEELIALIQAERDSDGASEAESRH